MKRIIFILVFCVVCPKMLFTQSNRLQGDASVSLGMLLPNNVSGPDATKSSGMLQFGKMGYSLQADCHSGIGSGWKIGLAFSVLNAQIDEAALNAYLLTTTREVGFFTSIKKTTAYGYNSRSGALQIANDIRTGPWIITPKFNLGLVAQNISFQTMIDLKEEGSNYRKEITITGNGLPTYGVILSPGIKVGYSFPFFGDQCCVFLMGDVLKYRCPVRLEYSTEDIHGATSTNIRWSSGSMFYRNIGLGLTYYVN